MSIQTSRINKTAGFSLVLGILILGLLSGCAGLNISPQPANDEQSLRTQAAMTMAAIEESIFVQMTGTARVEQVFPLTQTAVVQEYINSVTRTAEAQRPVQTQPVVWITPAPYPTAILQLPTPWYYPTVIPQSYPCYRAFFTNDVSYPDSSRVLPGISFVKTWRVQNIGSCTWNTQYRLIDQKNGSDAGQMVGGVIPPGGFAEISIPLTAPLNRGLYEENYLFRAADGTIFGVGSNGVTPIWIRVLVKDGSDIPDTPARTRIQFPWGAVSTSLNGRLAANGINSYVLRANQGQTMTVGVISDGNHALLAIYGLTDGLPLVRGNASGATSWQGVLPMSQDYALDVISDGESVDYVLQITIQ